MSSIVYKKLLDIENQRENPFDTKIGQEVVSIAETFWGRLAREGRPKGLGNSPATLPNNSSYTYTSFTADIDHMFYPKFISVSSDVDAELIVQLLTNIPQMPSYYVFRGYAKAGTPIILPFDGDIFIPPAGSINIGGINSGATAGRYWANIHGYEVTYNA